MTKPHSTPNSPALVWFRDDLRLADQPALHAAQATGAPLICFYILETPDAGFRALGGASRWWLHHTLAALAADLETLGGRLDLFSGRAADIVPALADAAGAQAVFWTRRYGAAEIAVDETIKTRLKDAGLRADSFNGHLLHEPWEVKTKSGGVFHVYSPYWRAALARPEPGAPLPRPPGLEAPAYPKAGPRRVKLAELDLLPTKPDWASGLRETWVPGEAGAKTRLGTFLDGDLSRYAKDRNMLAVAGTSGLSPHLRFGEISARQVFHAARHAAAKTPKNADGTDKFLSEIGWREFDYHVMFHSPDIATQNLQKRFDKMAWRKPEKSELDAWHQGRTGYPIVDAGMRELWTTGYMHNRVRMVAASFLIKHLLIDWRVGEAWFWDTLCDADIANNPMNWQWVAGCGADAAPFFRVFNPVLQGEKFDPDGTYVRRHVPELAKVPAKWVHKPWQAPADVLAAARVALGKTYPKPIVDHDTGRARALAAFAQLKG